MIALINSYTVDTPPMNLPCETYRVGAGYVKNLEDRPSRSLFVKNICERTGPLNARAFANFEEIAKLEEDWDGDGAPAPKEHVKKFAKAIVRFLDGISQPIFNVVPGPRGEIMIDIRKDEKSIEFLIYTDKANVVLFEIGRRSIQSSLDVSNMPELLTWLNR